MGAPGCGTLVLTNKRLIFTPLKIGNLSKLASIGLEYSGVPGAKEVIGAVVGWIEQSAADVPDIASVSVGRMEGSMLKPPSILVQRGDGSVLEFGIASSRFSVNITKSNVTTRDNFLRSIQTTLL